MLLGVEVVNLVVLIAVLPEVEVRDQFIYLKEGQRCKEAAQWRQTHQEALFLFMVK